MFIQCVLSLLLLCHCRAGASAPLSLRERASVQRGVHLYFFAPRVVVCVLALSIGERADYKVLQKRDLLVAPLSLSLSGLNVTPPGRVRLLVVI